MENEYIIQTTERIISKTDRDGIITFANEDFCEISGYTRDELIGKNHNIVRHHDMPSIVFKLLWVKLLDAQEVCAFVKNRRKNGQFYWVFATVTPQFDARGNISSFISVRKRVNPNAAKIISKIYAELSSLEQPGKYGRAALKLKELLESKGQKYNAFVSRLQQFGVI